MRKRLARGQVIYVRDNATGLYHKGTLKATVKKGNTTLYYPEGTPFVWCYRADIRTTPPRSDKLAVPA